MKLFQFLVAALLLSVSGGLLAKGEIDQNFEPYDRFEVFSPSLSASEIREVWQEIADAIALTGQEMSAKRLEEAVNTISDRDLEKIYGQADMTGLIEVFKRGEKALNAVDQANFPGSKPIRVSIAESEKARLVAPKLNAAVQASGVSLMSAGFPDATGYPGVICPSSPNRTNADALLVAVLNISDARTAFEIAQGIWSVLSRACDEIIVVLGEGFNTSLACIPVDVVLFAADLLIGDSESTVGHLQHCNDAVNSAEIEGMYNRSGHIHTDLVTHDVDISNQLATHDVDISNQLATHDTDIKALLGAIQETVDENQRLIKISMSRQLDVMRQVITPEGKRVINQEVLICTGDNCPVYPALQPCPNGSLLWNCGENEK
jgi:hypothetical protein